MKLDFEKWLDEKYENKLLSHINNNSEDIKKIFEESIICYKSAAYRAAIVMAMTGFDMIMKDRILKYKNSLEKLNSKINFSKNNLLDENRWDVQLMDLVINNDSNFATIFPNKGQWQLMWKERRNMRNNAAHGKLYKINYFDVESFYSWIMQAFYALYPVTALETLIEDINIFFDISKTPVNKPYDYIINNSLYISTENELEKIFECLYKIYYDNEFYIDNEITSKTINILSEIYNKKDTIFITVLNNFIKSLIDNMGELFRYTNSNFITDLLCINLKIPNNMTDDEKYYLFNNMPFTIFSYNKLYYNKIIDERLLLSKISTCSLDRCEKKDIEYIYHFVEMEIEKTCKELLSSPTFENTRYLISKIPSQLLSKRHILIIKQAYKNNYQVYNEKDKVPYLMNYIKDNFDEE